MFYEVTNSSRLIRLVSTTLFLLLLLPGSARAVELAERHQPAIALPVIEYSSKLSYEEYVLQTRALISSRNPQAAVKMENSNGLSVLDAVSPKQWPLPTDCEKPELGLLLIHGLSDSPFSMRDLGDSFSGKCVLIRSMMLPGHSTLPADLAEVTYQEWITATSWAIESFSEEVPKLVVVGFSTGGTLGLDYVLTNNAAGQNSHVDGLVLLAPAIAVNTSVAFLASWVDWLGKIFSERLRWASIEEDLDQTKYESFHMNGAVQINLLTERLGPVSEKGALVPVPVLVIASEQDTTISTKKTIEFFNHRTNSDSRMLLYSSRNEVTSTERIEVRNSVDPQQNILSLSHISIPFKPTNHHYGKGGEYKNCQHYSDDSRRSSCFEANESTIYYGEITKENRAVGTLRRISWNPDYKYMIDRIDQFINAL
mgnify:CR=1 FL=1